MKTKFFLVIATAILITAFLSCKKSKTETTANTVTPEQQSLIVTLKSTYAHANTYNDSLIYCNNMHNTTGSTYYDNCYHSSDSTFTYCMNSMMNTGNGMNSQNCCMTNCGGGMGMNWQTCSYNTPNADLNLVMSQMCQLRNAHTNCHPH